MLLPTLLAAVLLHAAMAGVPSTCKKPGQVVLSFDGGPGATTGRILDVLSRRNIPAAFFVAVDHFRNATWRGYVQRAAYEGHTVGVYVTDPVMPTIDGAGSGPEKDAAVNSPADLGDPLLYQKLARAANWITSVTGRPPRHIRFGRSKGLPNGTRRIAEAMGLLPTRPRIEIRDESNKMDVIWNSVNRAFNGTDPSVNSFIVRLRDIMPNTAASLNKLIDYIEGRGFTIVPLETCQPLPERLMHFKAASGAASSGSVSGVKQASGNGSSAARLPSTALLVVCALMTIAYAV